MVASAALVGKWQIVESGTWARDHLDLCGPAFLHIDADGTGEIAFGALSASVDGEFTQSGVDFDWDGAYEGDQVSGTGWANLRDDGWLEGEFAYDNGDYTTFIAKPWPFQQPVKRPTPSLRAGCRRYKAAKRPQASRKPSRSGGVCLRL